jgi:hypothetical protein
VLLNSGYSVALVLWRSKIGINQYCYVIHYLV